MARATKNTASATATTTATATAKAKAKAKAKATTAVADYDSPWKEALTLYLPECLALLAPWLYE